MEKMEDKSPTGTTTNDLIEYIMAHKYELFPEIDSNHENRFMVKLMKRFTHLVSIIPYLIKVFIVTIVIFAASVIVWNNYIRKDRHEVTLKEKIIYIVTHHHGKLRN